MAVARIRALHDRLVDNDRIGYARGRFTELDGILFADLTAQMRTYFGLDTPSEYSDAERETYGAPEDHEQFVSSQGALDRFAWAVWHPKPRESLQALVIGRTVVGNGTGPRRTAPRTPALEPVLDGHPIFRQLVVSPLVVSVACTRAM